MNKVVGIVLMMITAYLSSAWIHWAAGFLVVVLATFLFKWTIKTGIVLGAISLFLLWSAFALLIDQENNHILSAQIGSLFGGISSLSLVLITGILGGTGGALSGWLGAVIQKKT